MQLAIFQVWESGLLQAPVAPWSPLCWIFWGCFGLGALIQWLVLKKARRTCASWIFPAVLVLGMLAGEIGCQSVIGWNLLLPLLGWWLCLTLLLGSAAAWLAVSWKRRNTKDT